MTVDLPGWLVVVSVVALVLVIVGLGAFFSSLRRWPQPPPGGDEEAQKADGFLNSTTKNTGHNLF